MTLIALKPSWLGFSARLGRITQDSDCRFLDMNPIFVAYGEHSRRTDVLEFAVDQATTCGHELVVYHIQKSQSESVAEVRKEIETVVQQRDPYLVYDIEIDRWDGRSNEWRQSKQEQLRKAIFETNRDFEYVVMGRIERGAIEGITHPSMTKAILKEHEIPILLVPV